MIFKVVIILLSASGFVRTCCGYERSCKDVLRKYPNAASGIYRIRTTAGTLKVYCEMEANGGGYTFLPKYAITTGTKLDLSNIYTDRSNVLMRFHAADYKQPFSVLEQLSAYKVIPIGVQLNSYARYARPQNTAMGPYLYLGFLPNNVANQNTIQGLNSEGVDVTFRNCDRNPNSYFVLFPNPRNVSPSPYSAPGFTMHSRVFQSSLHVPSYPKMSANYFFFAEMHFGGCGEYMSTNKWSGVNDVAIGMR